MNPSLIQINHQTLCEHIDDGDIVVDATIGNGHDTLFLAKKVGTNGCVFGFDIQEQAIESTKKLLEANDLLNTGKLHLISHDQIESIIPRAYHKKIKAILFNLGYLPKSDKSIITRKETTIPALIASLNVLSKDGILSIMLYPGHPGGEEEVLAIKEWSTLLPQTYQVKLLKGSSTSKSPELLLIKSLIINQ